MMLNPRTTEPGVLVQLHTGPGDKLVLTFDREGIFAKESEALGDSIDGLL